MHDKDAFIDFLLDQLRCIDGVRVRAMFGGHGLYARDVFFAVVASGRVYFKTNEETRAPYEAAGMGPFKASAEMTLKNYFEVPVDVLEDDEQLAAWARESIRVGSESAGRPRQRRPSPKKR